MRLLSRLFHKSNNDVIIVSGLPRSGTSMTMRMLEAGGLDVMTDHIREANVDNPRGYYEFERVKKMPDGDTAWVEDAQGKVVKVISALLKHLPPEYTYKILFMRRAMAEILASQRQMLVRRGEDAGKVDDAQMAQLFQKHLSDVYRWLDAQSNVSYIDVNYNTMLAAPQPQVRQICDFLDRDLNVSAMLAVVDPALYRQRKAG